MKASLRLGWLAALTLLAAGCAPMPAPADAGDETFGDAYAESLRVDPASARLAGEPGLSGKLASSPHRYFRFVNAAFANLVCRCFADSMGTMPEVSLHGDAHLEQYAVTDAGRGITDFDDAARGPAVVDLVRFGVSVELACHQKAWQSRSAEVVGAFFAGYREGLAHPEAESSEPRAAARLRETFDRDRTVFLRSADGLMGPLPPERLARLEAAVARYAESMRAQFAELPRGFFALKRAGTLSLGVGSLLDEKYLLRVEGPSPALDDDLVLEAKEVRDLTRIRCVRTVDKVDPFRILVGPQLPYRPYLLPRFRPEGLLGARLGRQLPRDLDRQARHARGPARDRPRVGHAARARARRGRSRRE